MQLGTPITTISGGMIAVKRVILYPHNTIVPRLHTTPMPTTSRLIKVELSERKNSSRVMADKSRKPVKNKFISLAMRLATLVRIKGKPLICTFSAVPFSKLFASRKISFTSLVRLLLFTLSLSSLTPIKNACVVSLYSMPL